MGFTLKRPHIFLTTSEVDINLYIYGTLSRLLSYFSYSIYCPILFTVLFHLLSYISYFNYSPISPTLFTDLSFLLQFLSYFSCFFYSPVYCRILPTSINILFSLFRLLSYFSYFVYNPIFPISFSVVRLQRVLVMARQEMSQNCEIICLLKGHYATQDTYR